MTSFASLKSRTTMDLGVYAGLTAGLLFFLISGFLSYNSVRGIIIDSNKVTNTHNIILSTTELLSLLKDAETGQRGYLLTGKDSYLAPYTAATDDIGEKLTSLKTMTQDTPQDAERIDIIEKHARAKLAELNQTITVRRTQGLQPALAIVLTDRGKNEMDEVRAQISAMQAEEKEIRAQSKIEMDHAFQSGTLTVILVGLAGGLLSIAVAIQIRRSMTSRRRQDWLQSGQLGLNSVILGDQRVDQIGESVLRFLGNYLNAQGGAFFIKDGDSYRRVATYGIPADAPMPTRFSYNDGLLGNVAKQNKPLTLSQFPKEYLTVGSALGRSAPRHIVISPAAADGQVVGVFELGFMNDVEEMTHTLLEKLSEIIGIAVRTANYRESIQNFLEETQRQSEELQAQGEELRVSNEELSEQSRALRESQTRMEQQQAEMEETNAQLEEQAQLLETQRDNLVETQEALEQRSRQVEQSSQYKSEFLANMSHELRTPLNSALILSKLLADNEEGNLTDEQIKYAETIQSSGNDLLVLINDILDLSKIEAGHMEIQPEQVRITRIASDIARVFEPLSKQKDLVFETEVSPLCPEFIETDGKRLEQVLKNLLSNAVKFTEKGKVKLSIGARGNDIVFAVTDTGIGIDQKQHEAIFEAFRQADSTISRKYGGTGLGLSISRELARLLGGRIELESESGKGSTFTITMPAVYKKENISAKRKTPALAAPASAFMDTPRSAPAASQQPVVKPNADDDSGRLTNDKSTILIVEDDVAFSRILYDLGHELGFQCLIAHTADEAMQIAAQYLPNAVVLDVGLPDHSGLSVLDRLKQKARTRHIPVHVLSASDYSQTAYSMGAAGYMLKPIKRDELSQALQEIETKLTQRLRRVLIVEDDAVQLDSLKKLLGLHNVETVGASTAAECLKLLREGTFDCMVLDLSLPDASGHALLETLSHGEEYSFPPVIVYTGRDLSADEEQQLRRYSKTIIIKGAKSPERLLDEVTLFLHQVVSDLPPEQQRMLKKARNRDAILEGRRILVVEDDIRNVYSLTSILEPRGAVIQIARNGREALEALQKAQKGNAANIDLVLMDVMMPEMDGLTATREIRKNGEWRKLPIIMLTAKAMKDDQERCIEAGANDYMAKPLDVEKLLSLVRVWMPR